MLGAVIMLLPQTKLLNWNDVDIPWHLMIFSAGAYSLGAGLTATKLMDVLTIQLMEALGMETMSYFTLYAVLTAIFIASHFIFQSKNMRTIICDRYRTNFEDRYLGFGYAGRIVHQLLLVVAL